MRRVVTISFTEIDAPGGVPRWNRDIRAAFSDREVIHYSWWSFVNETGVDHASMPEWERARILGLWLMSTGRVKRDDVILVDGFWGIGFAGTDLDVISVSHGNWSHTTDDDVKNGVKPEFPMHHAVQVEYRRKHLFSGKKIVAVSKFIAHQCKTQWSFDMDVINNGIDLTLFRPAVSKLPRKRPLVIHGTTTANKGMDHVEALRSLDADVWLLDEASQKLNLQKYDALAQADVFVHPSAHEGNSYMLLEALACGIPIVAYDVGLLYELQDIQNKELNDPYSLNGTTGGSQAGIIMMRKERSVENTLRTVKRLLGQGHSSGPIYDPRMYAEMFSIDRFKREWRNYVERYER